MSGSLPDPDGYRGFADSGVRGNGTTRTTLRKLIRESNQKVHKPQRKAQESNEKRTKFFEGDAYVGSGI